MYTHYRKRIAVARARGPRGPVITVNATAKPITYQCLNNANASYIGMNACDTSSSNYWAMTLSWGG